VTKVSRADGSFTDEEVAKRYYYHGDHLGSAQLVTNYRGEEYERVEYTPYGELWIEKVSTASNLDIPYRFTGKERDEETGLYYYGARYLDAKAGRWLSADPALGEYLPEAPVNEEARKRNGSLPGMGGVYNTINAHLYHYAGNNPVKYTDPDGKYITITDTRIATAFNQMYKTSEIFRNVINNFARDENILFQFSDVKISTGEYGNTNPRSETIPENSITVFTLNNEGQLTEVELAGGTDILVVFMNINVEKLSSDADEKGHSADLYLMTTIAHETGHGKDAQEKGFTGFWQEVKEEENMRYNERPSEIRNDNFAVKVMREVNE
jgi:RHS repeat-associated protein